MKIKKKYSNTSWLRKDVIQRDGVCVICGRKSPLTVHHVCGQDEYSILMNDMDNTVLLCTYCHTDFHQQYETSNPLTWTQFLLSKRTQVQRLVLETVDGRQQEIPLSTEAIRQDKQELMNDDVNITIISILSVHDFTEDELIDYMLDMYNTTESNIRAGLVKLRSRHRIVELWNSNHEANILKVQTQ